MLACLTVVPANCTGSKTATGVVAPVLPIDIIISSTTAVASSGAYLNATAPLGCLPTIPRLSKIFLSLIFTTRPSVLKSNSLRLSDQYSIKSITSLIEVILEACLLRSKPIDVSILYATSFVLISSLSSLKIS